MVLPYSRTADGFTPVQRPGEETSSVDRLLVDLHLLSCNSLLLLLLAGVELRPHTWDEDRLQLEAIKKGILERLGMPAPPVIRHRLDRESIRRAQRLYRQKVAELMRNRTREEEGGAGPGDTRRLELSFTANVSTSLATSAVLEVETHETIGRGARRARGLEEECRKSDGKCCLKSLKVSFQDIGWADWVIAPNSYYMKFCEGSCPHNYKPASMHAQIKARMHSLSKATPPPCCVPAGYDPMVLMHYDDEGRLVSTLFEDMLVTQCHCA
nr:PREDICTED: growth/differentiation factor 15 [Balearica regulorum gibbericeps]